MRKTFLSGLLLFVAAATLSGCSKDETTDPAMADIATISATVEEPTRTMLDGAAVKWVAGDKIMVANTGNGTTAMYTLTTGAGQVNGTFTGNDLDAGAKFALYPYSAAATCASGKFSFEMPATQDNGNLTFGNGANPMIAQSDAQGVLNFQNVCGVIKLTFKGTQKVGKIVVTTATTAEKLSGKATVAFVNTLPVLTLDKAAANTVTLNCNNAQLTADAATSFYVVLPAATYAKGLQFEIYDETGAFINSLPTSKELIVTRSQVAPLPVKTIKKINFPDAAFRAALAEKYKLKLTAGGTDINMNDVDNQAKFTSLPDINVYNKQIASMRGIEYFTGLTKLACAKNKLTSLDVSKNTKLMELICNDNLLTDLDVSQNKKLTQLSCYENQLTKLELKTHAELTYLDCHGNQLKDLDVKPNTALTNLYCYDNQLQSLDVSQNTKLTKLKCHTNQLADLDLSKNTALTILDCCKNQLKDLDLKLNTKITRLDCYTNQLPSLDIQPLTSLSTLFCGRQLAGGVVAPNYSELKLYMTQTQFDANLGTGQSNDKVTRMPPFGI